jgi:signal recognition particle subunit SRP54
LEPFHPDRLASRILGMGDVLTLIEKAEQSINHETAAALEQKIRQASFTLDDFREQLQQLKQMGPLDSLMAMLPGIKGAKLPAVNENEVKKIEAIINSMTPEERSHHHLINGSRRKRIARGSGTSVEEVNRLLKQFAQTQKLMRTFMGKKKGKGKWPPLPLPRPF